MLAENSKIREENGDGRLSGGAYPKGLESCFIERHDVVTGLELRDDLGEIPRQRTLPTERIDSVGERRADKFVKTLHAAYGGVIGQAGTRRHGEEARKELLLEEK